MTAQENVTTVVAALNTALPAAVRAYDVDKVPTPRPGEYVLVEVSRRFGGNLKAGGSMDVTGYRIVVRGISRTSVANVRTSLETCRAALEFVRLTVGTEQSTPVQFETEGDPVRYDDGWFSGDHAYTYAL